MSTELDRGAVMCGPSGAVAFPHQQLGLVFEVSAMFGTRLGVVFQFKEFFGCVQTGSSQAKIEIQPESRTSSFGASHVRCRS